MYSFVIADASYLKKGMLICNNVDSIRKVVALNARGD